MPRDEFWDALKEHAHRNHQERVSKNPDRIAYAIQQFEAHGIEYQLKNRQTGHFHCWRKEMWLDLTALRLCTSNESAPVYTLDGEKLVFDHFERAGALHKEGVY